MMAHATGIGAAIKHLNATHPGTRVFAIPGNDFAAYRWGDTVDTPQPAFLNRDFITREQQIMGSIATADTLYATDGPIQDAIANPNALAPMSRLMGAGDLMVEYDQQYERYGVPQPQLVALQLLQTPLGLTDPMSFGVPRPNTSVDSTLNEQDLSVSGNVTWPSPIVTYTVPNPRPMVRGESDTGAVVMEGDATGLRVIETPVGRVGTLICWENYMPLARYTLYAEGVEVYVASTWDEGETWIATVPIGYADGIRRALTNNCDVLIGGRRYPLVGTVSMDNITVDLGPEPVAREGEGATIIGRDGPQRQTAEDLARRIGTINYEVLTGISRRVPRVYHRDGEPA